MPPNEYKRSIIEDGSKDKFSMISILLVVLAIAWSVGEAAFQLLLEIDKERAARN
jgi:hypothetical protein